MQNELSDLVTLTFDRQTPKQYHFKISQGHSYIKFEHFGIIRFELCCGQTDRQTNRRTRQSYPRRATLSALIIKNSKVFHRFARKPSVYGFAPNLAQSIVSQTFTCAKFYMDLFKGFGSVGWGGAVTICHSPFAVNTVQPLPRCLPNCSYYIMTTNHLC